MRIGFIGYSAQKFDVEKAKSYIKSILDLLSDPHCEVVAGLTNLGIPALAYEEALSRGLTTVGFSCSKALKYECFPVDKRFLFGDNWGDESQSFLEYIDILVIIGGGENTKREELQAREMDIPIIQYPLESFGL